MGVTSGALSDVAAAADDNDKDEAGENRFRGDVSMNTGLVFVAVV